MFTKAFVLLVVAACYAYGQIIGGQSGTNPSNQDVRELLEKAIIAENAKSNAEPQEVVQVLSASSQVVSGSIYTITYLSKGLWYGNLMQCEIKLHDQPWVSETPKILSNKCIPA